MTVDKPNEEKKNINGEKSGDTDENKDGGIKKGIKRSINEGTNGELLLKKKYLLYYFF